MKTTMEQVEDKSTKQRRQSADPEAGRLATGSLTPQQNALTQRIAAGPVMTAQRKVIEAMATAAEPVQKQSEVEEDELMQGKFTAQLQGPEEDEELLQGAFETDAPRTAPPDTNR